MDKLANIEIKILGSIGNIDLTPDTYDIKELITMLEIVEDLLFPTHKKDRPIISFQLDEGSVKQVFKTSVQYIIGFNALLGQIKQNNNIDFLEIPTAKAIENIQEVAKKKNYNIEINTSIANSNKIKIDAKTQFYRTEVTWVEAEFYFYGKITNAGGKNNPNIHLFTEEFGTLIIQIPQKTLASKEENILYKNFGIRVKGKQNSINGEIDTSSLKFIELIDYQTTFNKEYIQKLRNKAKENWVSNIDAEQWLKEIRGYE